MDFDRFSMEFVDSHTFCKGTPVDLSAPGTSGSPGVSWRVTSKTSRSPGCLARYSVSDRCCEAVIDSRLFEHCALVEHSWTRYVWTRLNTVFLDTFGHVWTRLDTFGHVWTRLDTFWTRLDTFGHDILDTFGHVWTRSDFGHGGHSTQAECLRVQNLAQERPNLQKWHRAQARTHLRANTSKIFWTRMAGHPHPVALAWQTMTMPWQCLGSAIAVPWQGHGSADVPLG